MSDRGIEVDPSKIKAILEMPPPKSEKEIRGIYCYIVMSFVLKNAKATYQRMVTALLHDMMHNKVEVYVDDMIVKSKDRENHTTNLRKFFERIKEYRLILNP